MLDRAHAGSRVAVVTGPVALPDAGVAAERLREFARLGPAGRIALRPDPERGRWRHDPEALSAAVVTAPAPADAAELLRGATGTAPFRATLAGDYLLTEHDHGIGEVQLALVAHLLITGALAPTPELYRSISRPDDGLFTAAARVFGTDPRRVWQVLTTRDRRPESIPPPLPVPGSGHRPDTALRSEPGSTSVEVAVLDAESVAEIRERRRALGVAASVKTLILCALVRALAEAGVSLHQDIVIPVDLRRYLRRGVNPLGNFVTGLEFRHRPGDDPAELQRALAATIASGRPVASAIRSSGVAGAALLSRRGPARADSSGRAAGEPARLLYSGVNELPEFRRFPWRDVSTGGHFARVDPATPDDLTATSVEVHGRVTVSLSFDPSRHRRDVICTALRAFAADPTSPWE